MDDRTGNKRPACSSDSSISTCKQKHKRISLVQRSHHHHFIRSTTQARSEHGAARGATVHDVLTARAAEREQHTQTAEEAQQARRAPCALAAHVLCRRTREQLYM